MAVIKALRASVMTSPVFMRRVNGWFAVIWVAMIPVSYFAGWLSSVTYVSALSLWALVSGHWSAWQAARVEVKQEAGDEEDEQRGEHDNIASADLSVAPGAVDLHEVGDQVWTQRDRFGFRA